MYLTLLFLPLFGSLTCLTVGRFIGTHGSRMIATSCISIAAVLSMIAFYEVAGNGSNVYVELGKWISLGELSLDWAR